MVGIFKKLLSNPGGNATSDSSSSKDRERIEIELKDHYDSNIIKSVCTEILQIREIQNLLSSDVLQSCCEETTKENIAKELNERLCDQICYLEHLCKGRTATRHKLVALFSKQR